MKVLLVNTNRMKPAIAPIGLDYLADSLAAAGHTPCLLDLCFAGSVSAAIEQTFRGYSPEVIGVTIRNTDDCYFHGQSFFLTEIREIITQLRQVSAAPIVLGGVGYSTAPEAVLDYCGGDYGIAGEGEVALVELLAALSGKMDVSKVSNLVHRVQGTIHRQTDRPVNLAALPPRRRSLPDNARYFQRGGQAGFETKRGCPMHCLYCADPVSKGHTSRLRPPASVVAELSALLAQGIDHFHTCDSEFNLPVEHAREVCQVLLAAGLGNQIRWYAYCAPTPFDDETAALFKRAGCAGIDFGADSGTDEMLRRLGRHFGVADLERTATICRRHAIPFMFDLLLGGPGETRKSLRQTIEFIRRINPDCVGLSLGVRIYAGTPLAREIAAGGDGASHPGLRGCIQDNPNFLRPVFYVSPELGDDLFAYVRKLIAGDQRFFLPDETPENCNYNYSDNTVLVRAIEKGARGAFWNILRQQAT